MKKRSLKNDFDEIDNTDFPAVSIDWEYVVAFVPLVLFAACIFISNLFTVIDSGEVGAVSNLRKVSLIGPGPQVISPISTVTKFSRKTQLLDHETFVPTKEGLTAELDTSVLYKIKSNSVKDIYVNIGKEFS